MLNILDLLSLNNIYLCRFFEALNDDEINNIICDFSDEDALLIYYRLNITQRSRIFSCSYRLRKLIIKIEHDLTFLPYVEPVIIINENETIDDLKYLFHAFSEKANYIREFVIVEKDKKFYGILYFVDIMNMISENDYDINDVNLMPILQCSTRNKNIYPINENVLIDIHRFIVVDQHERSMGVINIDYVLAKHDLYICNKNILYAIKQKNILHVINVVAAVLIGTIVSLLLSQFFGFNDDYMIILMLLRCVNDIIVLMILEDRIHDDKFIKYIFVMLFIISICCSGILLYLSSFIVALQALVFINILCGFSGVFLKFLHDQFQQNSIFFILIFPEILLICYLRLTRMLI